MPRVAATVAACLLCLAACGGSAEPTVDVVGYWWPVEVNGEPVELGVNTAEAPWLQFTTDEVGGNLGCNGVGGAYTLDGDRLSIEDMVSELELCAIPDGGEEMVLMEQALGWLLGGSTLSLDGDQLTMERSPYNVVLVAAEGEQPPPEPEPQPTFGPLVCAPGVVVEVRHPDDGTSPADLAAEFEPRTASVEQDGPLRWWGSDAEGRVVIGVLLGDNGPDSDYQIVTCSGS